MDDLLAAAGAENVDFPLKTACCGGAHTLSDSDTSTKLVLNILQRGGGGGRRSDRHRMPDLPLRASRCTRCAPRSSSAGKTKVKIVYFTQLLGMALGLSPRKVGMHENISDSLGFFKEKGIA